MIYITLTHLKTKIIKMNRHGMFEMAYFLIVLYVLNVFRLKNVKY